MNSIPKLTAEEKVMFGHIKRRTYASGISARFFAINNDYGIKVYYTESDARFSYYWSRIMYHMGLSPEVWDLHYVRIPNMGSKKLLAFKMRRVKVIRDIHNIRGFYTKWSPVFERFANRSQELGFVHCDSHTGNFGYRDGKLYTIDVGSFMVNNQHLSIN